MNQGGRRPTISGVWRPHSLHFLLGVQELPGVGMCTSLVYLLTPGVPNLLFHVFCFKAIGYMNNGFGEMAWASCLIPDDFLSKGSEQILPLGCPFFDFMCVFFNAIKYKNNGFGEMAWAFIANFQMDFLAKARNRSCSGLWGPRK
jgi:hypothetical protein